MYLMCVRYTLYVLAVCICIYVCFCHLCVRLRLFIYNYKLWHAVVIAADVCLSGPETDPGFVHLLTPLDIDANRYVSRGKYRLILYTFIIFKTIEIWIDSCQALLNDFYLDCCV